MPQKGTGATISVKAILKNYVEPAYMQVAARLRREIADGTYPFGSRLPSALSLSRQFQVSPMTVRQAILLLSEEGLLRSLQGSGTYVKHLDIRSCGFSLNSLADLIGQENAKVRILKIRTQKPDDDLAAKLRLEPGARVVQVVRLLMRNGPPVLLQRGYVPCDPERPLVEAELDAISLAGFFTGRHLGLIKKCGLEARAWVLDQEEAELLEHPIGSAAFLMEYLFYDFQDLPIGSGTFVVPHNFLAFTTQIGLWAI